MKEKLKEIEYLDLGCGKGIVLEKEIGRQELSQTRKGMTRVNVSRKKEITG